MEMNDVDAFEADIIIKLNSMVLWLESIKAS